MEESPSYLEIGSHPIRHSIWSEILCRGDMKTMVEPERQTRGLRSGLAATGDLPTIAFFRAGPLLRRNGPVPGILAAARPGAIMDTSGRHFVATNQLKENDPHTKNLILPGSLEPRASSPVILVSPKNSPL